MNNNAPDVKISEKTSPEKIPGVDARFKKLLEEFITKHERAIEELIRR